MLSLWVKKKTTEKKLVGEPETMIHPGSASARKRRKLIDRHAPTSYKVQFLFFYLRSDEVFYKENI